MASVRIGHSADADDAFMFWGLASGRVQAPGIQFRHQLRDIETLNRWAIRGWIEVTAMSAHTYGHVWDRYDVLRCGMSLGRGYGPLVVAREKCSLNSLAGETMAVPGRLTTSYLVLRLALPDFSPLFVPTDKVMDAVLEGRARAGVLIHEGQLTYRAHGLEKVTDLGAWWKRRTGLPLPLGVVAIKRGLDASLYKKVTRAIRDSISLAQQNSKEALDYASQFAPAMDRKQLARFVRMYAGPEAVDCGKEGRRALEALLKSAHHARLLHTPARIVFAR